MNFTLISDEKMDALGYPILPLGDRTSSRRVAKAQKHHTLREVVERLKSIIEERTRETGSGKIITASYFVPVKPYQKFIASLKAEAEK